MSFMQGIYTYIPETNYVPIIIIIIILLEISSKIDKLYLAAHTTRTLRENHIS